MILKVCIVILCLTICTKADTDFNFTSCITTEGLLCVPYYLCDEYVYKEPTFLDFPEYTQPECDNPLENCCKPEKISVINQL